MTASLIFGPYIRGVAVLAAFCSIAVLAGLSADCAFIAIYAIFGLLAEIAWSIAPIKRVADRVGGAPALLDWKALEGRRFFTAIHWPPRRPAATRR